MVSENGRCDGTFWKMKFHLKPFIIGMATVASGCAAPGWLEQERQSKVETARPPSSASMSTVTSGLTVVPMPSPITSAAPALQRPRSTERNFNFNYQLTWPDQTGLSRVFDDGGETYLEFIAPPASDFGVFALDGRALPFEQYDARIVVRGVHETVLVRSRDRYTHVSANTREPVTATRTARSEVTPPDPGVSPELAGTRAKLSDADRRLKELAAEIKSAERGATVRELTAIDKDIEELQARVQGIVATMVRVHFVSGDTTLELSQRTQTALVDAAKRSKRVLLRGRTDSAGAAEVNERIARARALSAKRLLIAGGADATKINISYLARGDYVASNGTADGRAKNRRVEFVFLGEGDKRIQVAIPVDRAIGSELVAVTNQSLNPATHDLPTESTGLAQARPILSRH